MAVGLGAEVTIVDRSIPRLRQLDDMFNGRVRTRYSTLETIDHEISLADAVIGAVLIPGASAPRLVTREMLKRMKPGAVLVDVAIDQGGCIATSRETTHTHPVVTIHGVQHYAVGNMPGAVPTLLNNTLQTSGTIACARFRSNIGRPRRVKKSVTWFKTASSSTKRPPK
jgi:alanine dehydrogenase